MMSCFRSAALLLLSFGFGGAAETPAKPACTKDNAGSLWPEEANDNPEFAAALKPYGYPEICTFAKRKYSWKSATVSLEQLRRDASKKRPISSKGDDARKQAAIRAAPEGSVLP